MKSMWIRGTDVGKLKRIFENQHEMICDFFLTGFKNTASDFCIGPESMIYFSKYFHWWFEYKHRIWSF